jgi:uncharacterized protein
MSALDIRELVDSTPWIDTHEHLLEESTRLQPPVADSGLHPCDDWAYLLWHYALDDLCSAGLPAEARARFISPDVDPAEKWPLVATYHVRASNTAYLRAARISVERLFGLSLGPESVVEITARMQELRRPGFYAEVLQLAGVASCQVNSLEHTFCETAQPGLLEQDIGLTDFVLPTPSRVREWQTVTGRSVDSIDDLLAVVDDYFARFGRRAVAVKLGTAYVRPLKIGRHDAAIQPAVFTDWINGRPIDAEQSRAIEDVVLDRGFSRAVDHCLPMKIHTGYHVGNDRMNLHNVRGNVADVCALAQRYSTTFVLMHMGYPHEHEVLAATKHFANVVADLCWAWIVDPIATRTFVKRFLVTAPASKLLCFGGDYIPVENVVGHSAIARSELARALGELRADGYLDDVRLRELVPKLMHGNATQIFERD